MIDIPVLQTDRLTLRAPSETDFPALAAFYASDRSQFVGGPQTAEQTWRTLASELGHWALKGYGRWAVEISKTGDFIGLIGLWNPEGWPEEELGWDLMNGFEGNGYATEAAVAARRYAYEVLGWPTLMSLIRFPNTRSIALAERMGAAYERDFTHERHGHMGVWRHPAPGAPA
ncbi:MAG: GNAT family N-acetyltransferase [Rhodobacter sp.]|nr:GNAT family N-acetyltransferase [Rhodobacter sp.]